MAVESDAMRLEFLQDWGDSSTTFTDTSASSTSTITALFSREYLAEDAGGEVPVETSAPFATVRTTDVPSVVQGDTLTDSDSTVFTIVEVMPDNEGMTRLRLRT